MRSKISVVMATYNGMTYIEEQLDSIRLQTLKPDEVIICDDDSKDNTFEFLCSYVNQYKLDNWKIFKNNYNIGWIKNFYQLFELTDADIIFCADQDDFWLPDKIEKMSTVMDKNNQIKVLGGNFVKIGANKRIKKSWSLKGSGKETKIKWNGKFYLTHRPGCTLCFKKELLMHINKLKSKDYPHDQLIWNIACVLDNAYLLDQVVIFQRRHEGSAMIKKKKLNNRILEIDITLKNIESLRKYITEKELGESEKIELILKAEKYFQLRSNFLKKRDFKISYQLIKYISYYPRYRSFLADFKSILKKN